MPTCQVVQEEGKKHGGCRKATDIPSPGDSFDGPHFLQVALPSLGYFGYLPFGDCILRIALTFLLLHFFFTQMFKDISSVESRARGLRPATISVTDPRHYAW